MDVFLFTDIEGSTERWLKHKEVMGEVLARHDDIVRGSIERYGGREVKHTGDGFFVVFDGGDPLGCALGIQRGIQGVDWGEIGELRVRVVVHAGEAEERGGDYFGSAVIRGFRMLAAAWGGQVLVTPEVKGLCLLPEGASFIDLGVHQLKDLGEPQSIYQLDHPDLVLREFPALRTLSVRPHNLPPQPTPFIGREDELGELTEMVRGRSCRLLTLIGPGGIGKTRLALQVGAEVIEEYQHGVYFIPLAQLTLASPQFLVFTIAEGLRFSFYSREDPKIQLMNYLREKELLLVMDNFEHVIEAVDLLAEILSAAPKVKILATSRERLNLKEELTFEVRGLDYPEDVSQFDFRKYSAVQLFLQHAKRVNPKFTLDEGDRALIGQICRLVGGMPLGIELAASWVRALNLENINYEIERSLDFLKTSLRNIPERHRSLRAVFDYSWNLLSENEQKIFRRLSVFRGSFDRDAAQEITETTITTLSSLLDKSLLRRAHANRYEVLDVLRIFGDEKQAQNQEEQNTIRGLHSRYYLTYLKNREKDLIGARQMVATEEIGREIENIRAAWKWAVKQKESEIIGSALSCLQLFYERRSWFQEGKEVFANASDQFHEDKDIYGRLLVRYGAFCMRLGMFDKAQSTLNNGLEILKQLNNRPDTAFALNNLGAISRLRGDYDQARRLFNESLEIRRETDDRRGIAISLGNLGNVAYDLGEYEKAKGFFKEGFDIFKEIGDLYGLAASYNKLGVVDHGLGSYDEARRLHQEGLKIEKKIKDNWGIAAALNNLGNIARALKEYDEARELYTESINILKEIGDRRGIGLLLSNIGRVACLQKDFNAAKDFFEESLAIRRDLGLRRGVISTLSYLGEIYSELGDLTRSKACCEEGLRSALEVKSPILQLEVLVAIGRYWFKKGDDERGLEVMTVVLSSPAINEEVRTRVNEVLGNYGQKMPGDLKAEGAEVLERFIPKVLDWF